MELPLWVWQIGNDYVQGLPDDDAQMPMSSAYFKANDGLFMMGNISPGSPVSVADVARIRDIYYAQNLGFVPWGVARGGATAASEGSLAGRIAQQCSGVYIVDLEDGPGYWSGGNAEVDAYINAFRNAGGRELWLCPDTRVGHLAGISFDRWLQSPTVTKILPQIYWVDFQQSYIEAFAASLVPLNGRGLDARSGRVYPVLQGDAPDLIAGAQQLTDWGYPGWSVWRRGTLTPANVATLNALGGMSMPPPVPVKTYEDGLVEGRAAGIQAARDALAALK